MSGHFSLNMMKDWENDDVNLLKWRAETGETSFEKTISTENEITEQEFFDNGLLLVSFVRAGVELAFETMTESGIIDESAYYESLHETPLIANLISKNKLFEMNKIISDTAEYGCYLFDHACKPLLKDFMNGIENKHIGEPYELSNKTNNQELIKVNDIIRNHPVELIGKKLRASMTSMKQI
jgi:ketol-acid reductoisomerase